MRKQKNTSHIIRILSYLLGMFLVGAAVNLIILTNFGAGPWDTVTFNLSKLLSITLGTASGLVNFILLIFVILYNKKAKYILIIVPIVLIAVSIDFWNLVVFKQTYFETVGLKFLMYILGVTTLTFGLALLIVTKYPAMIFDELTISLMRLFKIKSFFRMRVIIELFAIILAIGIGFLAGIGFGNVNIGSFVLALIIGPMIAFHLSWLTNKFTKI